MEEEIWEYAGIGHESSHLLSLSHIGSVIIREFLCQTEQVSSSFLQ
jgi:hypothetical protein